MDGRSVPRNLTLLLALLVPATAPAIADDIEAKVEAAYLFHLTKFVDWPALPAGEFRICIVGSDSVGGMMRELSGRPVKDRPLRIQVDAATDPAQCQILFIDRSDRRLPELLKRAGAGVLTVSNLADFVGRGGIVGFYPESGRIRLEINPDAARAANLHISGKLLEVARTVPAARN